MSEAQKRQQKQDLESIRWKHNYPERPRAVASDVLLAILKVLHRIEEKLCEPEAL